MTEHGAKWDISAVEIEAAAWIAQIDGGRFSDADKAALREWCARSEAHREALRRQGAIWSELDSLAALPAQLAAQGRESAGRSHLRWRPFWVAHAALAVLIVAVLVTWIGVPSVDRVAPSVQIYATRVGELKTIVLNDQSTVRLNTNSLVEVDYRPNERRIRLVKGEALFDVAKDPRRRFVVHASDNTVRAVGTRFSVRLLRDQFEVVVSEGVVELTRTIPGSGQPVQSAVSRLEPRQAAYLDAESAAAVSIETLDVGRDCATPVLDERRARVRWRAAQGCHRGSQSLHVSADRGQGSLAARAASRRPIPRRRYPGAVRRHRSRLRCEHRP
jgi:transmembrane sensor